MKNLSLVELSNQTASKEPVPGGGSISAVCGVLSAALSEMVANLTIGKKKYSLVEAEMEAIKKEAFSLRESLLDDIEKDSDACKQVMNAYSMPKENEIEKQKRHAAIQEGLIIASIVPLEVAKKSMKVMELSVQAVEKGNRNSITDALVSVMLARTAILGALLNVKINLESIEDEEFCMKLKKEVDQLQVKAMLIEEKVMKEYF